MKLFNALKTFLVMMLLFSSLNAEEISKEEKCDNTYNLCMEKCEALENESAKCFKACDLNYDKCLESSEKNEGKSK
ncbi:MAG: hypothetical protein PF437_03045 [Sulfurimonas sp.]|jgi:hypothetical protein|nr:hypothetical protein [Sulfurimonas sp.]